MQIQDPNAVTHGINIGTVGIIGSFLGMPLEALILGAIAGAVTHGLKQQTSRRQGISTIITSTLLAGSLSPATIAFLSLHLNFGDTQTELEVLKPLVPVVIGAGWTWFLPLLQDGIKTLYNGWINKLGGVK